MYRTELFEQAFIDFLKHKHGINQLLENIRAINGVEHNAETDERHFNEEYDSFSIVEDGVVTTLDIYKSGFINFSKSAKWKHTVIRVATNLNANIVVAPSNLEKIAVVESW